MNTLELLFLALLPGGVGMVGGYFIGKMSHDDKVEERRWAAYDAADLSDSDEAWEVYHTAFPEQR